MSTLYILRVWCVMGEREGCSIHMTGRINGWENYFDAIKGKRYTNGRLL